MPGIPRENINDVWNIAEPFLKKGIDRMLGAYRLDELKEDCLKGNLLLWIGKTAEYALLIKVSQYHSYKSCAILAIGGDNMNDWIEEMKEIEDHARSQGCRDMVISGAHSLRGQRPVVDIVTGEQHQQCAQEL